jgi:hypothetical protein
MNWRIVNIFELALLTNMASSTSEISSNIADIIMDLNSLNLIQEQAANWTFCGL